MNSVTLEFARWQRSSLFLSGVGCRNSPCKVLLGGKQRVGIVTVERDRPSNRSYDDTVTQEQRPVRMHPRPDKRRSRGSGLPLQIGLAGRDSILHCRRTYCWDFAVLCSRRYRSALPWNASLGSVVLCSGGYRSAASSCNVSLGFAVLCSQYHSASLCRVLPEFEVCCR